MGLLEKLQGFGCQLKLVQVVPKTKTAPKKIVTREITLQELITELEAENVRLLAESPIELTINYEKIFETAGIKNRAGEWTIERLNSLLQSSPYDKMGSEALLTAVMEKLAAENVSSETLVRDALAKDQALDSFENFVSQKMKKRSSARKMHIAKIESQIQALLQEKMRLQNDDDQEQRILSDWIKRKQAFEQEMLKSVDLLMNCTPPDENKIVKKKDSK